MAANSDASAAKAKRYDRQLRIWGAHGQDALEQAHICLLNAGGPSFRWHQPGCMHVDGQKQYRVALAQAGPHAAKSMVRLVRDV